MALDSNLGVDMCRSSCTGFYLAVDCLLFSSIASSAFVFSIESIFNLVLLHCALSRFFIVGNRLFFARFGLSAARLSFENEF